MQTIATTAKSTVIYTAGVIGGTAAVATTSATAVVYFVGSMLPAAVAPYAIPVTTAIVVHYTEPTSWWARLNPVYLVGYYAASKATESAIEMVENKVASSRSAPRAGVV